MYTSEQVVVIRHKRPIKVVCDVCGKSSYIGSIEGLTYTTINFNVADLV
jgi:hypothetical protein